ncbi:MAG: hypothetical protein QNK37_23425 [Acidobacteriota bacterium]|nr:hypothetical protein [Acidobacteriota bacterium]
MTLESGSVPAGEEIVLGLYVRDVSGSCVDSNFAGAFLLLRYDVSLVDEISLEPAGLSLTTPLSFFLLLTPNSNDGVNINIIAANLLPFTLNAPAPGDLLANLRIRPALSAAGQTITFTGAEGTLLTNGGGSEERESNGNLQLNLGPLQVTESQMGNPPVINSFSADPSTIDAGASSLLSWDVSDADSVSISPEIGNVGAVDQISVSPSETTQYTLTATNDNGTVTQSVTVTVNAPPLPEVVSFTVSPDQIIDGDSTTLSWQTAEADTVMIEPGIGPVAASGSVDVSPSADTTYTITASSDQGSDSAEVSVDVFGRLEIVTFAADPAQITPGGESQLRWEVSNSSAVVLDGFPGDQSPSGSVTVSPAETTTYTLNTSGALGQTASATATVEVVTDPALLLDAAELDFGKDLETATVTLSKNTGADIAWSVSGIPDWLEVTPTEGILAADEVQISITAVRSIMFPGAENTATLTFSAAEHADTQVQITLARAGEADGVTVRYFPLIDTAGEFQADLTLLNTGDEEYEVNLQTFGADGAVLSSDLISLTARANHVETLDNFRGWAVASVTTEDGMPVSLEAVLNTRDGEAEKLHALSPVRQSAESILVPHVAQDTQFDTLASVVHLGSAQGNLNFNATGADDAMVGMPTPGSATYFDFRQDLYGGVIEQNLWGSLALDLEAQPLAGVEVFNKVLPEGTKQTVGVSLSAETSQELYYVHIAQDTASFWTGVVVINLADVEANIQFQAYNTEGVLLDTITDLVFAPGEKKQWAVIGDTKPFGEQAAWLRVTSDQPMTGYELFGTVPAGADQWAGFEAVTQLGTNLVIPHTENGVTGGFTGIAIVNPNDSDLQLTFQLVGADGNLKTETQDTVLPFRKVVSLVSGIFAGTAIQEGDTVFVTGDKPMAGFELYGSPNRTLGAIIAPVKE